MDNWIADLEKERDNLTTKADVVNLMRFEQKDYAEEFDKGKKIGEKVGNGAANGVEWAVDAIGNFFGGLGGPSVPDPTEDFKGGGAINIDNINKVGEVGSINETVDISSEDLRTMRELAEMKNIQNFVTLTPQLAFGDTHIRQDGRSIDEIVTNIAQRMEQEISSSARGVFSV